MPSLGEVRWMEGGERSSPNRKDTDLFTSLKYRSMTVISTVCVPECLMDFGIVRIGLKEPEPDAMSFPSTKNRRSLMCEPTVTSIFGRKEGYGTVSPTFGNVMRRVGFSMRPGVSAMSHSTGGARGRGRGEPEGFGGLFHRIICFFAHSLIPLFHSGNR